MAEILLGNVKGPQGNTGATGSQGPQGDAATITVGTVSTTAYGNTAQVINSGTEQDAVLDFVIPQGKPGEQTTRMGALTLDTITAQSADFPIPAVGETGSTVFGKIIKFFNSTISALNSKLNISDVVNNLTSTSTTQPLSAAQGKALNDALATTNNNKQNKTWTQLYSGPIFLELSTPRNITIPDISNYSELLIKAGIYYADGQAVPNYAQTFLWTPSAYASGNMLINLEIADTSRINCTMSFSTPTTLRFDEIFIKKGIARGVFVVIYAR